MDAGLGDTDASQQRCSESHLLRWRCVPRGPLPCMAAGLQGSKEIFLEIRKVKRSRFDAFAEKISERRAGLLGLESVACPWLIWPGQASR